MARLPGDNGLLIQQHGGIVELFHEGTQEVYVSFDPASADECAIAQGKIWNETRLTDEQRCFAIFWSGYFYAHARGVY